jgi:hypothetical protein
MEFEFSIHEVSTEFTALNVTLPIDNISFALSTIIQPPSIINLTLFCTVHPSSSIPLSVKVVSDEDVA